MSVQYSDNYMNHPLFQEALQNFQKGSWETGLAQIDELRESFPLEDDLRSLRLEMHIKSKIDDDEKADHREAQKKLLQKIAIRTVIAAAVIGLLIWSGITYASVIQQQWEIARQRIEDEAASIELSVKFRNAQNLMLAGRPSEAKVLFEEIVAASPEYPEIQFYLGEVETLIALEGQYNEAISLLTQGKNQDALTVFKEISLQDPTYKDVPIQIDQIERGSLLNEYFNEANTAYTENRWEDAISGFESIHALDPLFKSDEIEEKLFLSYLGAAETILEDPEGTIEALESARGYFQRALALRPRNEDVLEKWADAQETIGDRLVNSYIDAAQASLVDRADSLSALEEAGEYLNSALELRPNDERVILQSRLVSDFLLGIEEFRVSAWNEVISHLEPVVEEDSAFANGAALQTLYEAYIARGNDSLVSGEYELALFNYQQAAIIAQKSPKATLLLYEAQIKAARAQGLLFNFEGAVALYQSASEFLREETGVLNENLEVINLIFTAEAFVIEGNYRSAYLNYKEALDTSGIVYENTIVHVVQEDEYLTMIASRYNTTVQAIAQVNDIPDPNKIAAGQEIIVPIIDN